MSRRAWIGVAAAAIVAAACASEASPLEDGAMVQTTTTTARAIEPPPPNASLPLTISFDIGAEREEPPPDWTAGTPLTRWEDMQLTFQDSSADERYAVWAPLVDQVLDALWEAVRTGDIISQDFSAGFDAWGAPTLKANSDEVEAFIRGLFPPDIAERIEIRRETSFVAPEAATP